MRQLRYVNPVLQQDFSDPDVIRDGDDFYMVSSSFNFCPAIPVLHSKNLVEWELLGYVLNELPADDFREVVHGGGVWAPSLRKHGGTYYCLFPVYGKGIWACKTNDIGGGWSAPWQITDLAGAEDPCPIWTDDGRCYLAIAFAKSKAGFNSKIAVYETAPDLSRVVSDYKIVYDGCNNNPCIEGPKFYTHGGYIYIYAPAGGVKHGWQTALRSKNIYGPYESKIVLAQGDSYINGPHQGALVDLPDGGWAFVHFRDMGAYGRVTYLEPAKWVNGWCLCGEVNDDRLCGSPVENGEYTVNIKTDYKIDYNDNFTDGLSPVWQTPANSGSNWYKIDNGLRICADECDVYSRAKMLTQRFSAFDFIAETSVDVSGLNGYAALAVTGGACYSLCLGGGRAELRVWSDGRESVAWSGEYKGDAAKLSVAVSRYMEERSRVTFYFNGERVPVSLSAVKDKWTGARVALYANGSGEASFKYFKVDYASDNSTPIYASNNRD